MATGAWERQIHDCRCCSHTAIVRRTNACSAVVIVGRSDRYESDGGLAVTINRRPTSNP
jgi:hypothetical protein